METMGVFVSWIDNFAAYRRERFPLRVFLPVALGLTVASFADATPAFINAPIALATTIILLFQFRLWDDLADRLGDRARQPSRLLCRAADVSSFYVLLILSGLASAGGVLAAGRFAGFIALCVIAFLWYAAFSEQARRTIAGRHVLLLKYPAFAWLFAPAQTRTTELISSMTVIYLCSAIYELRHDQEMRSQPIARALMIVEVCALGAMAVVMFHALGESI
jgi:uncharacterized membrane protein